MIYGTACKNGKLLFTWENSHEQNIMANLLHGFEKKEFFADHVVIELK